MWDPLNLFVCSLHFAPHHFTPTLSQFSFCHSLSKLMTWDHSVWRHNLSLACGLTAGARAVWEQEAVPDYHSVRRPLTSTLASRRNWLKNNVLKWLANNQQIDSGHNLWIRVVVLVLIMTMVVVVAVEEAANVSGEKDFWLYRQQAPWIKRKKGATNIHYRRYISSTISILKRQGRSHALTPRALSFWLRIKSITRKCSSFSFHMLGCAMHKEEHNRAKL